MVALLQEAQQKLAGRDLDGILAPEVLDALELTYFEVQAFCALLMTDGQVLDAQGIADLKPAQFRSAVDSLVERGLIERADLVVTFAGAATVLRLQTEQEAIEQQEFHAWSSGAPPKVRLTLRSLRQRVILLARTKPTLAPVYGLLYGGTLQRSDFAILAKMKNELGPDKAALLLLEFCHRDMKEPLKELIPYARARAAGFRPEDAPDVAEQKRYQAMAANEAWKKRMKGWLTDGRSTAEVCATRGFDLRGSEARQVQQDFIEWGRQGQPAL